MKANAITVKYIAARAVIIEKAVILFTMAAAKTEGRIQETIESATPTKNKDRATGSDPSKT